MWNYYLKLKKRWSISKMIIFISKYLYLGLLNIISFGKLKIGTMYFEHYLDQSVIKIQQANQ